MTSLWRLCTLLWVFLRSVNAIDLDVDDPESIKNAAATAAYGMMSWYKGNLTGQIPGLLPQPYYWWEAGAMFMCLIDYWATTGDASYNPTIMEGMLFQVGPYQDFMPPNQTASMGNDDQAFWAMAALSAAENNFPDPPGKKDPSWLGLAQAVFNEQIARWDDSTCAGGLHWQAVTVNLGYNLKNTISNGALMQISARLARYLNDDMYADWATKLWDWMVHVKLIDAKDWSVYDNTDAPLNNCTTVDKTQWTYNAGTLLIACATMYNYTEDVIWRNRTENLLDQLSTTFFTNGIMKERCEDPSWVKGCNNDQHSFKAYLSRWMAATTQMAPFTYDKILKLLRSSAIAAAKQCSGGPDGKQCGLKWYQNEKFDGDLGPGQQMAAMEVFLGTLVKSQKAPVTNNTGGTSISDPNAGYNKSAVPPGTLIEPAQTKDKAGAWLITALFFLGAIWSVWFLQSDFWERERIGKAGVGGEKSQLSLGGKGKDLDRANVSGLPNIDEVMLPIPKYRGGTLAT